jgi:hypothetical protein
MAAGRSLRELRGRINLSEPQVLSNWKGLVVVRALARKINQIKSATRSGINAKFSEFAARWKIVLTKADRDRWEEYANLLGSAVNRDKEDAAIGSHNIIRQRKKLMSGFNAYVMCNMAAYTSGLPTPKDIAPIGDPTPNPPLNLTLSYAAGAATVTWTDPIIPDDPLIAEKRVRIWAQVQSGRKVHTQLVTTLDIPTAGTFTFDTLRCGGAYNSPTIMLGDIPRGLLRVQMDTVIARTTVRGAVIGPPSEVVEEPLTP